ncbi:MAG: ABC transporter permease, partial [Acetobacteraceae bacterium]
MIRTFGGAVLVTALALGSGPAAAQGAAAGAFSGNALRIGVLNDQSGLYAQFGGQGSVEAARMAVEDFGGKVDGVPIEI